MLRLLFSSLATLLMLAGGTFAADLLPTAKSAPVPPAPSFAWTGFYFGVQGGGAWGASDETFYGAPNTPVFLGTQNYNLSGGIVGGLAGYDYQIGSFVVGLQGDYNWAAVSGRSDVINLSPNRATRISAN